MPLSRRGHASPTEWRRGHEVLDKLFAVWSQPTIDLFATKENKVLPIFCSPFPDESAWAVDALSADWDDFSVGLRLPSASHRPQSPPEDPRVERIDLRHSGSSEPVKTLAPDPTGTQCHTTSGAVRRVFPVLIPAPGSSNQSSIRILQP